ncbi:hypothetical protein BOX15_Mlig021971g3 [Macrostomum lignano]|uniref:Protein xylosyltransferase n=2 Tax=Macrostomum lignano TaxID=282301 RepID=A0A267FYA8_9PLAT|nr:hypothetical protein BOX15_Mlig021971g3 [Macrostomum lignano]
MLQVQVKTILLGLLLFNAGALIGYLMTTSMRPSGTFAPPATRKLNLDDGVVGGSNGRSSGSGSSNTDEWIGIGDGHQILESQSAGRALRLQARLGRTHRQAEVACDRLLAGDPAEQKKAQQLMEHCDVPSDYRLDERMAADSCTEIRQTYVTETMSQEEADFPLAFSLVVFKDFYQVEKLFRAVYRPEHFYCFHVDNKSSNAFFQAVTKYASCFPNVIVSESRSNVNWGTFTVLEADLHCMKRLLEMSKKWRYFINLVGQEYPLRTMRELVRILKSLNGANNLENAGTHRGTPQLSVQLPDGSKKEIQWYKGSVHITATRGFVEYVFSSVGRQIIEHLRKHGGWPCPDETLFASLNHNPDVLKVPGADLTGLKTDNVKQPFLNRYKNWLFGVFGYPCLSGKAVRQICIWGIKDLPAMNKRPEFFVNKFYYNFQRLALQCMVERFWNNTLADYRVPGLAKTQEIPLHFYTKFQFVKKHI